MAIVSLNSELEVAGAGSKSLVLALPMLSDSMANGDLSQDVLKMLLESVCTIVKSPDAQEGIWSKIGAIYEQWLRSFLHNGEDEDGREDSQHQGETAKSGKSTDDPAMSDSQV